MDMLEGVFFMQNLISVPVPMTSCRQEAYLQRLRRQFPFVYIRPLTRTAFGRRVWALQLGGGSRKVLVAAGPPRQRVHHVGRALAVAVCLLRGAFKRRRAGRRPGAGAVSRYHGLSGPADESGRGGSGRGVCAPDSPEYRAAAAIAAQYPEVPFPSGWKANLRGVDLNLNYPAAGRRPGASKGAGRLHACSEGFRRLFSAGPAGVGGARRLCRCVHPDLMLALHTQGSVIYPGPAESAPGRAAALAAAMSEASGYPVEPVPEASANAGFKDWFLQCFRRPAFTIEMGIGENPLPMTQLPALCRALRAIMTAALLW